MGIESDQLVYEYLSRVGDLAQRRQLPSGDRMRLVSALRDEIDRRRAKYEPDTPAAVAKILERIGTPEEVLETRGPATPVAAPVAAVPMQRRTPENVPPHLAGLDELGPSGGAEPDWWRVGPGGSGKGPQVEGFAGGIEIPDLFKEPAEPEPEADPAPSAPAGSRILRFLRARREKKAGAAAAAPDAAPRPRPNLLLLLAAAVLVAGAVAGSWMVLGAGWLLGYASRVLGPRERKWVLFGVPGAVFTAAMVWLWTRRESVPDAALGETFHTLWPTLARTSAVALAAYLTLRARRR
ncbi:hypothetical protein OOK31_33145 [Streptomyces sp. NBC_00249]|uniref:hypothetical protein n=1 Tax=Streptomyces sp. NBC_00249 TaxID=2975690 RepID=UPI002254DC0D|nr:hypothetical protein [Streptomyces sp. NBC_00249]MCX5198679.1 hypothetical protein [Streptomyces sp. NBC_00249]